MESGMLLSWLMGAFDFYSLHEKRKDIGLVLQFV